MTDPTNHTAATPDQHPEPHPGDQLTRRTLTIITAAIAALAFVFSFGNVWQLGLHLGVSPYIAPLVGPAVDLSVVGLLIAIRHLTLTGTPARQVRPARLLLAACGTTTLALNIAEPTLTAAYGRAAFDAVGPLLLIGWSEVGPALLRLTHDRTAAGTAAEPAGLPDLPTELETSPAVGSADGTARAMTRNTSSTGSIPGAGRALTAPCEREATAKNQRPSWPALLARARALNETHLEQTGHPIAADTLRQQLRIGSQSARRLTKALRQQQPSPESAPVAVEPL